MTLLSNRVEKAKELRITKTNGHYNTWGSKDETYQISLSSGKKEIITPDGFLNIPVFYTTCSKLVYNGNKTDAALHKCEGNSKHTVCYHCLGIIHKTFKDTGSQVSFFSTYHDAFNGLSFGGYIATVENNNGSGSVWCVVKKNGQKMQELKFELVPENQRLENE